MKSWMRTLFAAIALAGAAMTADVVSHRALADDAESSPTAEEILSPQVAPVRSSKKIAITPPDVQPQEPQVSAPVRSLVAGPSRTERIAGFAGVLLVAATAAIGLTITFRALRRDRRLRRRRRHARQGPDSAHT